MSAGGRRCSSPATMVWASIQSSRSTSRPSLDSKWKSSSPALTPASVGHGAHREAAQPIARGDAIGGAQDLVSAGGFGDFAAGHLARGMANGWTTPDRGNDYPGTVVERAFNVNRPVPDVMFAACAHSPPPPPPAAPSRPPRSSRPSPPSRSLRSSRSAPRPRSTPSPTASPKPIRSSPGRSRSACARGGCARAMTMLLPMMRRHGVGMWIVVNEEFHDDPLSQYVAPPRPYTGNRDLFVFVDAGSEGLRKFADHRLHRGEPHAASSTHRATNRARRRQALRELYAAVQAGHHRPRHPRHAAGRHARSATTPTASSPRRWGPRPRRRFVSAGELIEEYLDTRLPEELPHYTHGGGGDRGDREARAVQRGHHAGTHHGGRRAQRALRHALGGRRAHLVPARPARAARRHGDIATSRGFLAVAPEGTVILPGDVVHIDFGITYMGFDTDWQKMAYVLRARRDATHRPASSAAMAQQQHAAGRAHAAHGAPRHAPAATVFNGTMAEMRERGIEAMIYSHPHRRPGARARHVASTSAARCAATPRRSTHACGSARYISIELNTATRRRRSGTARRCS